MAEPADTLIAACPLPFLYLLFVSACCLLSVFCFRLLLSLSPSFLLQWLAFYLLQRFYMETGRALKRLDAVSRSPIYSLLSECLTGLPVLRALRLQPLLRARFAGAVDANSRAYFFFLGASRWLGVRLDAICLALVVVTTFAAIALRNSLPPALVGLSISQTAALASGFQWTFRQYIELSSNMTSVQRVREYGELPTEAVDVDDVTTSGSAPGAVAIVPMLSAGKAAPAGSAPPQTAAKALPAEWPSAGGVAFSDVWMAYRPHLPPVLRGLTADIRPGMKVGVVGRTGGESPFRDHCTWPYWAVHLLLHGLSPSSLSIVIACFCLFRSSPCSR